LRGKGDSLKRRSKSRSVGGEVPGYRNYEAEAVLGIA